jgi:UDP-N-acetylmuramoylalanine--D-glutamate ligase
MNFLNKIVGIFGFGIEGKSIYNWLTKYQNPKKIIIFDENNDLYLDFKDINICDYIIRSPGIHPNKILSLGIPKNKILNTLEIFYEFCRTSEIIGVTGTKGKGTTSQLIYEIFKKGYKNSSKNIFIGGNIGIPFFDFIEKIEKDDIVVLELSSFQLYNTKKSPKYSVFLRTNSEHLNWHENISDYQNAKTNIFKYQLEDDIFVNFSGNKNFIDTDFVKSRVIEILPNNNEPFKNDSLTCNNEKEIIFNKDNSEYKTNIYLSDIALRGNFQKENVFPAIVIANEFDINFEIVKDVIKNFKGLPMRCEKVGEFKNRYFYNDSFSTIPETSISAISTFSSPLFIILGGSNKKSDFTSLATYIAKNKYLKGIYLIGDNKNDIRNSLVKENINVDIIEDFDLIIEDFMLRSLENDSLLLSPGSASFGLFTSYKDRGKKFNKSVKKLFIKK